jgi:hypothetical protein
MVKAWVESLKQKEVVGRMRVQRTFHERRGLAQKVR